MNRSASRNAVLIGTFTPLLFAIAAGGLASPASRTPVGNDEDFFIVSSVDVPQKRLVLKRPSEVTVLVRVTDKTTYRSEQNRPLQLADLRAGDTVFVRLGTGSDSDLVRTIRKGPMTPEELRRRYLRVR